MARFTLILWPVVCFSLETVCGCGGVTSSTSSSAPVPESQFSASYAQAVCDLLSKCCRSSIDTKACEAAVTPPAKSPFQKYDPTGGAACIAGLRNLAPSCTAPAGPSASDCGGLYVGTQAIGDPCTQPQDCIGYVAGESFCFGSSSSATCQPTLKLGDRCNVLDPNTGTNVYVRCGAGLYCATSEVCAPKVTLDQPCDQPYSTDNCVAPLRCNPPAMTCGNLGATGASCVGDSDCLDGYCASGTCQATIAIADSERCSGNGALPGPVATVDAGM